MTPTIDKQRLNDALSLIIHAISQDFKSEMPTEESVLKKVRLIADLKDIPEDDTASREWLKKHALAKIQVTVEDNVCLEDANGNFQPWYPNRIAHLKQRFWRRFESYLRAMNIPPATLNNLDQTSSRLVGLLGDPESSVPFSRKGLIVGDVQSGKTMNFTAIANKAADAGYRLIFFLTSNIESLRKQTQSRLDREFSGKESSILMRSAQESSSIGVAEYTDVDTGVPIQCYPITNTEQDFNAAALRSIAPLLGFLRNRDNSIPVYCVLKKNSYTLSHLNKWLENSDSCRDEAGRITLPALIFDDEADYASVNVNSEDKDPTRINAQIRELIAKFSKVNYVAVTATPFANIFINPEKDDEMLQDDLFPRDFIYCLGTPSNYRGIEYLFGHDEPPKMVSLLEDLEEVLPRRHKKSASFDELPESLRTAINYFCLANAVMDLNKSPSVMPKHRSMLVHISHYTQVHKRIKNQIEQYHTELSRALRDFGSLPSDEAEKSEFIAGLHQTWETHRELSETGCTWEEVLGASYAAVAPILCMTVNSDSSGTARGARKGQSRWSYVDYPAGLRVIVIGGNSLARGLTLEGLIVSYFRRTTQMYDTLLQQSRWFGYRDNYETLCRLWTTDELVDYFQTIAAAYAEFKADIIAMQDEGLAPERFGIRIRHSRAALLPTARNKMRTATTLNLDVDIIGRLLETPTFSLDKLEKNRGRTLKFLEQVAQVGKLEHKPQTPNYPLWRDVSKDVVANFIETFSTYKWSLDFQQKQVAQYIRESVPFETWDIAIATISRSETGNDERIVLGSGVTINPSHRRFIVDKDKRSLRFSQSRVSSGGAIRIGLSKDEIKQLEESYRYEQEKKGHPIKKNLPDDIYLRTESLRNPILIVHFVLPKDTPELESKPIVALTLGIPGKRYGGPQLKYLVNLVEFRQQAMRDGYDDTEEEEEDDVRSI